MNSWKQVWVLLKFQITANPYIFFMLIAFSTPLWLRHIVADLPLDSLLQFSNLFFVGILAATILAPEIRSSRGNSLNLGIGTEFLLTRAVDKAFLCRARSLFFYGLVVIVPLLALLLALRQPDLHLVEYSKISRQNILSHFPHAKVTGDLRSHRLLIPFGQVWIAFWGIFVFLTTASVAQFIVWLIYPLRYRRYIFLTIFLLFILLPIGLLFAYGTWASETFFFAFVAHPFLYGVLLGIGLISGQLWCERRFVRLEF